MATLCIRLAAVVGFFGCTVSLIEAQVPAAAVGGEAMTDGAAMSQPNKEIFTLDRAYARVLASDQSIAIALLEIRNAEREKWSALTRLAPELTASLGLDTVQERRDVRTDRTPVVFDSLTRTGLRSDVSRSQLLWRQTLFDFTVFPAWRQGRLSTEIAVLRQRHTMRQILFGVTRAYYASLREEAVAEVARETVSLTRKQLDQVETRARNGDAARADVLAAEAAWQSARRALVEAEGAVEQRRFSLTTMLNLDGDGFALTEPVAAAESADSHEKMIARALAQREDYLASARTVERSEVKQKEVAATFAPRIVAQASYDRTDIDSTRSNADRQRIWAGAIAVQLPIFTGGERELNVARLSTGLKQARLEHEKLAKSIREEVHAGWIEVRTLRERLAALEAERVAIQQHYDALQTSYRAGVATNVEVLTGLRDLNQVRITLTAVRYEYQVARCNLERAQAIFGSEWIDASK